MTMNTTQTQARRHDPATSHTAARRVDEFRQQHHAQILRAMPLPPEGRTVHEIASACSLDAHAVGKRMKELQTDGEVEVARNLFSAEVTRPSPSGRPARVWVRVAHRIGGEA